VLPGLPPRLKARLFAAFDISVLWNKPGQQATVHAEITDTTLQATPGLLDPTQDGYHDTDPGKPARVWDLDNPTRTIRLPQPWVHAAGSPVAAGYARDSSSASDSGRGQDTGDGAADRAGLPGLVPSDPCRGYTGPRSWTAQIRQHSHEG
jgi:hypothetical protein